MPSVELYFCPFSPGYGDEAFVGDFQSEDLELARLEDILQRCGVEISPQGRIISTFLNDEEKPQCETWRETWDDIDAWLALEKAQRGFLEDVMQRHGVEDQLQDKIMGTYCAYEMRPEGETYPDGDILEKKFNRLKAAGPKFYPWRGGSWD